MTGDTDMANAVFLDQACLQHFHGGGEVTHRIVDAAADAQHLFNAAARRIGGQQLVQLVGVAKRARRQMRDRLHAVIMQPLAHGDGIGRIGAGKEGHIDRRAFIQTVAEALDLGGARRRDLDGPVGGRGPDLFDCCRHDGSRLHILKRAGADDARVFSNGRKNGDFASQAIACRRPTLFRMRHVSPADMPVPGCQAGSEPPFSTSCLTRSAG